MATQSDTIAPVRAPRRAIRVAAQERAGDDASDMLDAMRRIVPAAALACAALACAGDDDEAAPPARRNDPGCETQRDPDSVSRSCKTRIESEPHLAVTASADVAVAWIGIGAYD